MQRFINIIFVLLFFLCTSIGEPEPLPDKIQLNELITWDTKRDAIQLSDGWLKMSESKRDSLRTDAWEKMETIKENKNGIK